MFKNSGSYAKFWGALVTWLVGAVPVIIAFPNWKAIVAYVVPAIGGLITVYLLPNTPPAGAQGPAGGPPSPAG